MVALKTISATGDGCRRGFPTKEARAPRGPTRLERTKAGDGMAEGVELGPVGTAPQYERVGELVAGGARAAPGGRAIDGSGVVGDCGRHCARPLAGAGRQ